MPRKRKPAPPIDEETRWHLVEGDREFPRHMIVCPEHGGLVPYTSRVAALKARDETAVFLTHWTALDAEPCRCERMCAASCL